MTELIHEPTTSFPTEKINALYIHNDQSISGNTSQIEAWEKEYPINVLNAIVVPMYENYRAITRHDIRQRISIGYVEPQDIIEANNGRLKVKKIVLTHLPLRQELIASGVLSPEAAMFYAYVIEKKPAADTRTLACKDPMQAYCYACFEGRKYHPETFEAAMRGDASSRLYRRHISNIPKH